MVRSLAVLALVSFLVSQLSIDAPSPAKQTEAISDSANVTGSSSSRSGTKCSDLSLSSVHPPALSFGRETSSLWISANLAWATSSALLSALSLLCCLLILSCLLRTCLRSSPDDLCEPKSSTSADPFTLADQLGRLRIGPAPQSRQCSWLRRAQELQLLHPFSPPPLPHPATSAPQLLWPTRLQTASLVSAAASLSLSDKSSQSALFDQLHL